MTSHTIAYRDARSLRTGDHFKHLGENRAVVRSRSTTIVLVSGTIVPATEIMHKSPMRSGFLGYVTIPHGAHIPVIVDQ